MSFGTAGFGHLSYWMQVLCDPKRWLCGLPDRVAWGAYVEAWSIAAGVKPRKARAYLAGERVSAMTRSRLDAVAGRVASERADDRRHRASGLLSSTEPADVARGAQMLRAEVR